MPNGTGLEVNRDEYVRPGPLRESADLEDLHRGRCGHARRGAGGRALHHRQRHNVIAAKWGAQVNDNDRGPVELRTAAIANVAYPDRTIDLVAVPYDEWAVVEYQGRLIEESVDPAAFGMVQNRARRFLVNMEHDDSRIVGNVRELRSANNGLLTTIKVRRTPEGDQALDDAADGMLGASIGMAVSGAGQQWETRSCRRITKAYLDHIALTFTPAYVGAEVLEVRAAPTVVTIGSVSATPNLDMILAERRNRSGLYVP